MSSVSIRRHRSTSTLVVTLLLATLFTACSEPDTATSTAGQNGSAPDTVRGLDFAFYREAVEPVFLRPRGGFVGSDTACIACHTGQATAPLQLEAPLEENGEVYWSEAQSRRNFESVATLVNPGDPDSSRLLMAPLAPTAGGSRHSGGIFWDSPEHSEYRAIAGWIAEGSPAMAPAEEDIEVDFAFFRHCVQPVFVNPIENAMPCAECHSGEFAVPPPADGYWTEAQSRQALADLMYLIDPGHPENSRFLHKPLHPDAGGDLMHNGGRRWFSADDPERQALADWVRGDARGESCPPPLQFDQPEGP